MIETVTVAIIGAGYAAELHLRAYRKVYGVQVRLKTIVDLDLEKATKLADEFYIEQVSDNFYDVLDDDEITVVDIVTPPNLHLTLVIDAMQAGKHVICEKPLTGYFGEKDDEKPIGHQVPKKKMYEKVLQDLEEARKVIEASNKKFMYAENYIYSPNVLKAAEIIKNKKNKILFMKGEESIRGSSSPVAGMWEKTGGGTLMRIGSHPIAGVLWLKQVEAKARNEQISIESVLANTGNMVTSLNEYEKRHLTSNPIDVEDFATVTISFSDGTKAIIIACDHVFGGTKNYIELFANDGVLLCNITPTNHLESYLLDQEGLEDVYFSEMLEEKTGWNQLFIAEEIIRGYAYELQDFMEAVAYDKEPLSGFDLAYQTTKVIYAAYLSASEGKIVYIDENHTVPKRRIQHCQHLEQKN